MSTTARPRDRFNYIMAELPTKGELVSSDFAAHLTSVFDSPQYDELARVVRFLEDAEIALGDLAQRGGSERRTRGQLGAVEQKLEELPQRLEERVVPRFEQTERAIDETAERQRDKEYSDALSPDHLDRRHPVGSSELRVARLEAAARQRTAAVQQRTLNPIGGALMAQPPRAGLPPARASALNPKLRLSSGPSPTRVAAPPPALLQLTAPSSSALVTSDGGASWRPAGPLTVAPTAAPAVAAPPPSAAEPSPRQPAAVNPTAAVVRLQDIPGGFPQLLRIWETSIAPFERCGPAWRSEKAPPDGVGEKEAQRVKDLITRWYLPALYAMMKLVEEGATRQDAAAKLQRDKGAQDISKFIKALPKPDAEAKARYRTMLFEVAMGSLNCESTKVSIDLAGLAVVGGAQSGDDRQG